MTVCFVLVLVCVYAGGKVVWWARPFEVMAVCMETVLGLDLPRKPSWRMLSTKRFVRVCTPEEALVL